MCFNVLHMQSPEVRKEVRGQWSLPNNFARSFQLKWEKRHDSPSILSNLRGKLLCLSLRGWLMRRGGRQFTQRGKIWFEPHRKTLQALKLDTWKISSVITLNAAAELSWLMTNLNFVCILRMKPIKQSTFPLYTPLTLELFCFAGTVKVKSSGIQVGDLIIVEKVC